MINLNPGDRIEYTRKLDRNKTKACKGTVIQITVNHITVDLGKYKDSFQLCDIGNDITITFPENAITILKEEKEVKKQDLSKVTAEQLRQLWEEGGYKKDYVRQQLGTSWYVAVNLLIQHGIIEASEDEEPFNGYPIMKHGHINWRAMWPDIQAELDKGTPRAEIAEKFNVSLENLSDMIRKERSREKTKNPKPQRTQTAPEIEPTPDPTAHLCDHAHEQVICTECGREIDPAEMYAIDNDTKKTTCFDCIPKAMTPEDVLSAEIEVTEDKPQELSCYRRLMFEPEELHTLKAELAHELRLITDSLEMLDLCLYWYDRGRQDGTKEE